MISHKGRDVANLYMNIPEELRLLNQWVCCKADKNLFQVNGWQASVDRPTSWNSFEHCVAAVGTNDLIGIGLVLTKADPYFIIDLDKTQSEARRGPVHQSIHDDFNCYSEVSLSGNGCHIVGKGELHLEDGKGGFKNQEWGVECYSSDHYLIFTGKVYNDKPIAECQELLNKLQQAFRPNSNIVQLNPVATVAIGTDEELIAKICSAANGEQFKELYYNGYPEGSDRSAIDLAFMNFLVFYDISAEQAIRIMKNSKLGYQRKIGPKDKAEKFNRKDYLPGAYSNAVNKPLAQIPNIDISSLKEALELKLSNAIADPILSSNLELPPGLLGDIASFIYQAAPRPVPEVALAAAIGLMAGICGRAYNISGTGLNQYVLLLAMTGAGKEAAASGINKIMNTIKMQVPTSQYFIGPSEISSGAALFKYLGHTSQSFISLLGEFGLRLQQMSSPNANGSEVSLRRMFLDLYNKSGHSEILHASVYSDKANNTSAVPSPSFSILGESTPERFYGALNEDMISEGLLPRFLLIEYKGNRPALNEHHTEIHPSTALIGNVASLVAQCEGINYSNPRRCINVQSSPEAAKMLYDFDKFADNKINSSNKEVIRQLWNRAHIKVLKLSALIAVGEHMWEPTIQVNHMEWAAKLVQADIAALTERFEAGEIGSSSFELKQYNEALRILKEYMDKDVSYIRKYRGIDAQHKDKVVNNAYLNNRLGKLSPFLNDKLGGTAALKRTLQVLIDAGNLVELKGAELTKYKTVGKLYHICSID